MGQLGVELFFVLSGFLIGNILVRAFMDSDKFSIADMRQFWIRRWFRTLPAYWLIVTADSLLYIWLHIQSYEYPRFFYYLFIQNLWYPHPRFFFGESWSLSVEEWFYLTLPICLYTASRLFKIRNKSKFLMVVFTAYLLVFVGIRFINAFHPINGPAIDFGIRKVVLFRLDAVMYGVLFAWLQNFRPVLFVGVKNYLLPLSIAGAMVIYYLLTPEGVALCASSSTSVFMMNAFFYLFTPLLFSLCLPCANGIKQINSQFWTRFFTHISKISYSMYLVHYSLIYIPLSIFSHARSVRSVSLIYLCYWVAVLLLSAALYRYFEYPVMQLREQFKMPRTKKA